MSDMTPSRRQRFRLSGILTALSGVSLALASAAVHAAVPVDQTPLTVQSPQAPNIVLMLDDSGSMAWNFMPDICYLDGVSCNSGKTSISSKPNNNALIDATNNGVYYDPAITYTAPIKVDGTSYADSPGLTGAWTNGFASSPSAVNITLYAPASSYQSSTFTYSGASETYFSSGGGATSGRSNVSFSVATSSTYTVTVKNVGSSSACQNLYNADPSNAGSGQTYSGTTTKNCTWSANYHYFQYSTGPVGTYTVHYIAPAVPSCSDVALSSSWSNSYTCSTNATNSGCGSLTSTSTPINCYAETDTSGNAAPSAVSAGQNVANWFSYYHTRILTAKSGLTTAFDKLDVATRFGFGSIDGNNDSNLPSSTYVANSTNIATVQSFDQACVTSTTSPCAKGASTTQRNKFWKWITGETVGGGTPLLSALDAVGQYYSTATPWYGADGQTELACRQSYTIMTTDGFWNGSVPSIGDVDSTSHAQIQGTNNQSYTYTAAAPYKDSVSNTLADVAMKYWVNDLRTSTTNEVPTSSEDPAFWQHMTTFTVGLGFTPVNILPSGTTIDQIFTWANGGASISNFSWPTPSANSINNIADLAHAAVDGHGGFYSATSPQAFANGIADAIRRVATRSGTGASLAANSTKLQSGSVIYQAVYTTSTWVGDLQAYNVNATTGAVATAAWNPSADGAMPAAASRNIMTNTPGSSTLVAFQQGNLSASELTALGSTSATQVDIINYLRGDHSKEQKNTGGIYRNRDTSLGDIINSQPLYVGAPDPNLYYNITFNGSDSYSSFANGKSTRAARVWIAANDGMLHSFNATNGVEVFAYLPSSVILNNVANLSNPSYGSTTVPHQDYNDGELTVADVYLGSTTGWRTVLVGTTGRGSAKAVYALDITDPNTPSLLWERYSSDGLTNSNYIGQVVGRPVISQTANGTWSVLVGNGYNSTAGTAALLQFNISTGALSYYPTDATSNNGLSAVTAWIPDPTNNISTIAYGGDLAGRVQKFDLTTPGSTASTLFTATDASTTTATGNAQPITAGMLAGQDPQTGNVWLFFGTGRYLSSTNDLTGSASTATQTWYGIIVQSATNTLVTQLANGRVSALLKRSIVVENEPNPSATPPTLGSRLISLPTTNDMNGKSGWYIDLLPPSGTGVGERMVTPNQFQGVFLLGTTVIPQSSDVCNPSGTGWVMAINPFTGTNPSSPFFDLNGDRTFNSSDTVTYNGVQYASAAVGFSNVANNPIFVGNQMLTSFDNATISSIDTAPSLGVAKRVSWREMVAH